MPLPEALLVHRAEFCAAFRLFRPELSDAENRALYGKCFSPNSHGHNYLLDVTVAGPVDPQSGMVMDLQKLASLVQDRIIQRVDHLHLNHDVDFLEGVVPTSENLAMAFWEILGRALPEGVRLHEIRLQESRDNAVSYRGPG